MPANLAPEKAFGVWRLAFGVWRLAFGVWRLAFGVWRLAFGVWRLAFGVWRLAFGVWRLAFGVWRLAFWRLAFGIDLPSDVFLGCQHSMPDISLRFCSRQNKLCLVLQVRDYHLCNTNHMSSR